MRKLIFRPLQKPWIFCEYLVPKYLKIRLTRCRIMAGLSCFDMADHYGDAGQSHSCHNRSRSNLSRASSRMSSQDFEREINCFHKMVSSRERHQDI